MALAVRMFAPFAFALLSMAAPGNAQEEKPSGDFIACDDAGSHGSLNGTLCAKLEAPLDYAEPGESVVELFVRKFPAEGEPKGQLWLVAGGPGESGASFYPFIRTVREAAPGFDLLIPDHRGTGFSTRLCPNEESPSSTGGSALLGEEWSSCFGALNADTERTRAFTISNAAHDLSRLISRIDTGEPKYLYGVSYGTQLVLRMLVIDAPDQLDGVILDSLVPLEDSMQFDLSHRSAVTDRVGRQVLRKCDENADCRKYLPEGAENALRDLLNREGIEEILGLKPKFQLSAMLDFPETRAMVPYVIAGLKADDPAWFQYVKNRLASIGAMLEPYPQGGSSIPLVSLISRSENNARPGLTAETIEQEAQDYLFASPLPSLLLAGGIPTYERDASFAVVPKKIPPTIVLHGTLDPKTPYRGAQEHVAALEAAGDTNLVSVKEAPHYTLMTAPEEFKRSVRAFIESGMGAARRSVD